MEVDVKRLGLVVLLVLIAVALVSCLGSDEAREEYKYKITCTTVEGGLLGSTETVTYFTNTEPERDSETGVLKLVDVLKRELNPLYTYEESEETELPANLNCVKETAKDGALYKP